MREGGKGGRADSDSWVDVSVGGSKGTEVTWVVRAGEEKVLNWRKVVDRMRGVHLTGC